MKALISNLVGMLALLVLLPATPAVAQGLGVGEYDCLDTPCAPGLVCEVESFTFHVKGGTPQVIETGMCVAGLGVEGFCRDGQCGLGEGGCVQDADCGVGLVCQAGTGERYGWDASLGTCERRLGHCSRCSPENPCGLEEGDCDVDADCLQGFRCYHDRGRWYGYDDPRMDVCVPATPRCPEDYYPPEEWMDEPIGYAFPADPTWWAFAAPLAAVYMDQDSGAGMATFDGRPNTYANHTGTDFGLIGSYLTYRIFQVNVRAAARGIVTGVVGDRPDFCTSATLGLPLCIDEWEIQEGRDNYVSLCHPDGTRTVYRHLIEDSPTVRPGDEVACGEILGQIGSSGRSASPHLHFEVSRDGELIDPYHRDPARSLWIDQGNTVTEYPSEQCR